MTKPIPDKAEVALEYPDKLYIGTFARSARFDDRDQILLRSEMTRCAIPGSRSRHAQPMGSPAARSAATSASSRAVSRSNWVFNHEAIVKFGRAVNKRLAVCFASSTWLFS
jgi:hypothetical protein